ncbi:MAG: putative glycolipid-binding domain-containing protein [Gaiellaceae bacterium]
MSSDLPAAAAWRLVDAWEGFEVLFPHAVPEGYRLEGHSTGVEEGVAWGIRYDVVVDERWATRTATLAGRSALGSFEVRLEGDGAGHWLVDGVPAPQLDGCLDVDLEASACTNCLPVRRLALGVGERAEAAAAYVRAADLRVERLEQSYQRLDSGRYDYASEHGFRAVLVYDEHGLIVDYPGIAVRAL